MANNQDLINHYHIPTEVTSAGVVHTSTRYDPDRRERRIEIKRTWSRVRRLGSGLNGVVFLEQEESEGEAELRAVKRVQKSMDEKGDREGLRELLSLTIISKDEINFPAFYGWFDDADFIYIVMEYFELGDLHQCLNNRGEPLTESEAQIVCLQLTEALEAIHKHSITHRDLKPNNIFVVSKAPGWWVKLGDFGISKRVQNEGTGLYTMLAGPYVAPEIIGLIDFVEETVYTSAVDIWSLGCVSYWLLTLQALFQRYPIPRYCQSRRWPEDELENRFVSVDGLEFIKNCLTLDPKDRPSATKAADSQWLKSKVTKMENVQQAMVVGGTVNPDRVDYTNINDSVAGRILIAHRNYNAASDPFCPDRYQDQPQIREGAWIELESELPGEYLTGSNNQSGKICFPRLSVYMPLPWRWCGNKDYTGLLIGVRTNRGNDTHILVRNTDGTTGKHPWFALSKADRRLVRSWTQADIMGRGYLEHDKYCNTSLSEMEQTTWNIAENIVLDGYRFLLINVGLIHFQRDGDVQTWPVEYVNWKDLLRLKKYFERLPEKILQEWLFPSSLADDEYKLAEFGKSNLSLTREDVSLFHYPHTLAGFSRDMAFTEDRIAREMWRMKHRDVAFLGAAIENLISRVREFQEGPLFKESLIGQVVRWKEQDSSPGVFINHETQTINIYEFYTLVRQGGILKMERNLDLTSAFWEAVDAQVDYVKLRSQKAFPLWEPYPSHSLVRQIKSHFHGGSSILAPSVTGTARKVYQLLKDSSQIEEGLHMRNIAERLKINSTDVQKASDELLNLGFIYSTIDDETWAIMDSSL